MPRATASAAAETAHAVLTTAAALFAEQGFRGVSLDGVARAAGVTRGAVYHHYGSKEGLFRAVAAHLQADVARAVSAAAERAEGGARERLRSGSHAFLDAITAARFARVLLIDAPAVIGWRAWRELDAQNSEGHLLDALAELGVPGPQLDPWVIQLSGAMNEAALWLAQRPRDAEARDAAHAVLDDLLDAVPGRAEGHG